jgi:hypothetical protein
VNFLSPYRLHVWRGPFRMYFGMCLVLQGHDEFEDLIPAPTVTRSEEPSSLALVIGFGALSSDGSARSNPPSWFSAIREGVTDPVKPDPSRTRIIVAKLFPLNIQCQVPANFSAVLEGAEFACRLIARASTAREHCARAKCNARCHQSQPN